MMNDDFVEDNILIRSDVKDLLRWKSVCKSWCSLISSPNFVEAHLKHHKNNCCNTRINNNDVGHTRLSMPRRWEIPNREDLYIRNKWEIVGSSNGLVCLSFIRIKWKHIEDLILLINPRTGEARDLPLPTLHPRQTSDISLSFAYDSSTDDYKLLAGITMENVTGSLVQVFSLKSMTWKVIGHINYRILFGIPGVLLNGAFHWLACDYSINKLVILSFDLLREEFKPITIPDDKIHVSVFSTLGIFQDSLCLSLLDNNEFYHGLSVMRNYNSWEFLPNDYEIKSPDAVYYINMYDWTSPTKKRTGFFCDDTPCFSRSLKHIISDPIYVQSLVSPYLNTDIPSHALTAKIVEREWQKMHMFISARKSKCYKGSKERKRDIVEILAKEG